jgi:DNA gyrase subunit B
LRELAFLNSRATIKFRALDPKTSSSRSSNGSSNGSGAAAAADAQAGGNGMETKQADEDWEVFHYSGGLVEYVKFLNRDKEPIHEPIYFTKTVRPPRYCA